MAQSCGAANCAGMWQLANAQCLMTILWSSGCRCQNGRLTTASTAALDVFFCLGAISLSAADWLDYRPVFSRPSHIVREREGMTSQLEHTFASCFQCSWRFGAAHTLVVSRYGIKCFGRHLVLLICVRSPSGVVSPSLLGWPLDS